VATKKVLTPEQKRAKGYVEIGVVAGQPVFLPLSVNRAADRIKDLKARAQFIEDSKAEYLRIAETRAQGGETANEPISPELTKGNGRCLIKQTGTRRWAFFSKEKLLELTSPSVVKALRNFAQSMPDSPGSDAE